MDSYDECFQALGYHRVVGLRYGALYTTELSWDQDQALSYTVHVVGYDSIAKGDFKSLDCGRLLCDVYTSRVVILGDECTSVLTPRMRSTHNACATHIH